MFAALAASDEERKEAAINIRVRPRMKPKAVLANFLGRLIEQDAEATSHLQHLDQLALATGPCDQFLHLRAARRQSRYE